MTVLSDYADRSLLLVDGLNLAYRSHYALKELKHDGQSTGVIHGFLTAVHALRQKYKSRVVVCWDGPRETCWRRAVYPTYKQNRGSEQTLDGQIVRHQVGMLQDMCPLLGFFQVCNKELEADDWMGVLSARWRKDVFLLSSDRDVFQALDGVRVRALVPHKGKQRYRLITQRSVENEWGFPVAAWSDYLALGGDSSDDIKPLPGIGPTRAAQFVRGGIRTTMSWDETPSAFRIRWARLEPYWKNVQAAGKVARILREFKFEEPRLPTDASVKERCALFVHICALSGLSYLIDKRWEFFQEGL